MASNQPRIPGRHFLQIPGPAPVPDRILRAMDKAVIDHRGPEFQQLGARVLSGIKTIFRPRARCSFTGIGHGRGARQCVLA
jgi:alanine-glyoxylate transaminase/serine-glyoxylate transaminase/serine-pyruvate transaminase